MHRVGAKTPPAWLLMVNVSSPAWPLNVNAVTPEKDTTGPTFGVPWTSVVSWNVPLFELVALTTSRSSVPLL